MFGESMLLDESRRVQTQRLDVNKPIVNNGISTTFPSTQFAGVVNHQQCHAKQGDFLGQQRIFSWFVRGVAL